MYRDTEQSYGEWTLDVYESAGGWSCDYWHRMEPTWCGSVNDRRRKEVIRLAKEEIDKRRSEPIK